MRRLLCMALVGVLAAGSASAQTAERRERPDPDANHDGKVTLDELRNAGEGRFMARLDTDQDGRISRAEFDVMAQRMAERGGPDAAARAQAMWTALDTDKDGFISAAERDAALVRRFNAADVNHDGWLSKDELIMMRQNRTRGD
jgi:Ca2+-binding EF-hand superfamily protein